MRQPLRYQILIPFAGTTILLIFAISAAYAYVASRIATENITDQMEQIARTLESTSFPWTDAVLRQIQGLSGAEFVVTDERGTILAGTLAVAEPLQLTDSPHEPSPMGDRVAIGGTWYYHRQLTHRPPRLADAHQRLHVFYPEAAWRRARWRAAWPAMLFGSIGLLAVTGLSLVLARRVTRPVEHLRRQVQCMAGGRFDPLPLPIRDDELRDLAVSINSLAEQLVAANAALVRSERLALLGQLSSGLAHQLRNAATGARMAIQLHQRRCDEDGESLAVALRQLQLTEEHLQQLLSVGQPQPLELVETDIVVTLRDVTRLVLPACRHRNLTLCLDEPESPVPVEADHGRLAQLFLNLLLNALEAAGTGGWVRVKIVDDPSSPDVLVNVMDSGPGPEREIVENMFEPFETSKPEGVGLGLPVARHIARQHGGDIRFERSDATTFTVRLPRRAPDFDPAAGRPQPT